MFESVCHLTNTLQEICTAHHFFDAYSFRITKQLCKQGKINRRVGANTGGRTVVAPLVFINFESNMSVINISLQLNVSFFFV